MEGFGSGFAGIVAQFLRPDGMIGICDHLAQSCFEEDGRRFGLRRLSLNLVYGVGKGLGKGSSCLDSTSSAVPLSIQAKSSRTVSNENAACCPSTQCGLVLLSAHSDPNGGSCLDSRAHSALRGVSYHAAGCCRGREPSSRRRPSFRRLGSKA